MAGKPTSYLPVPQAAKVNAQIYRPVTIATRERLAYLARFIICFLAMEFILHFMYVVAIKDAKAWTGDTAAQLSMIGFWNLIIVWLKVSLRLLQLCRT